MPEHLFKDVMDRRLRRDRPTLPPDPDEIAGGRAMMQRWRAPAKPSGYALAAAAGFALAFAIILWSEA